MGASRIPSDLLPRSRQIILPLVNTEDDREALLTEAFYLHDPLLYGIERSGAARVFAVRCIKKLLDHGCLPDGEHALSRLLETARYDCGMEKHGEIDALVQTANTLCADVAPKPPSRPTPPASPAGAPTQTVDTPRDERRPTVFISYSHADTEFAQKLIADLNAAGHACWIDTSEIKGGDEWIMTIAEGIINSYAFVPILSHKAISSTWVRKEILWAVDKKKRIVPLLLDSTVFDHPFFFLLKDIQGVTVFDSDYATALPKLLSYLPSPTLPDADVSDEDAEPEPESVAVSTPRSVPRKLELAYMERLRLEELLNTEKYTAMGGVSQVEERKPEMRAVFELLPMGEEREQRQETRQFENAVEEIGRIRRCVLLGEPGGGKTTTLWKLAADLVDTALRDRGAPLPVLIRLGKWTDPKQSLPEFIASQLGDLGDYLDVLLREKRAALLLDGLNEIPASQHKAKYPAVQAFVEAHPDLLAVVSCRELDYTLDLGFDRVNITPLDPLRIREFAGRYLGEAKGDDLFWRIAGGDDVRDTWQAWEQAGATLDLFFTATDIPRENPDVYGKTSGQQDSVWKQKVRGKHNMMELARNPYMLLMLTSVYAREGELPDNRGQLFAQFVDTLLEREAVPEDEQEPLVDGLAKVAYEMQVRRAEDGEDGSNAQTSLPEDDVEAILGERLLYLAGSASILSVGEQVRFTHQLLQEYFAATYMDTEIKAGRLQATDIWQPESWWERTNWEEAAILLAGLYSDDCSEILRWVAAANPEVAAQCAVKSGANVPDETLLAFRRQWLPRLTDLEHDPDPRARAAVGRALGQLTLSSGELLDNRVGVSVMVRDGVKLPDIDWVTIPGGEFQYGHEDESDNPPQTLTLPSFTISRYPVTYAQFQCFVDAEDYDDDRWWAGMPEEQEFLGTNYRTRELSEQWFRFWNHPRETVMWYQAVAFCRWLSDKVGTEVTLPTEQQWERAARGTDGREYPYEGEYDAKKGNTNKTGIRQTSAVGIFPHGASPEGVLDMSGNVFDWCLNKYENPEQTAVDDSGARRVLRGGAWFNLLGFARAVARGSRGLPNHRVFDLGFRLVVVRPPSRH